MGPCSEGLRHEPVTTLEISQHRWRQRTHSLQTELSLQHMIHDIGMGTASSRASLWPLIFLLRHCVFLLRGVAAIIVSRHGRYFPPLRAHRPRGSCYTAAAAAAAARREARGRRLCICMCMCSLASEPHDTSHDTSHTHTTCCCDFILRQRLALCYALRPCCMLVLKKVVYINIIESETLDAK